MPRKPYNEGSFEGHKCYEDGVTWEWKKRESSSWEVRKNSDYEPTATVPTRIAAAQMAGLLVLDPNCNSVAIKEKAFEWVQQ